MNPSITCPKCEMTSYHPDDIKNRYCGNCHQFHDDMKTKEYDDLLPVSLYEALDGVYHLLDRHNDEIATFDRSMEFTDMERIVTLINKHPGLVNALPRKRSEQ